MTPVMTIVIKRLNLYILQIGKLRCPIKTHVLRYNIPLPASEVKNGRKHDVN